MQLAQSTWISHLSPDRTDQPDAFNTFTPHTAKASAMPSIHPTPAVFQQHLPWLHWCISLFPISILMNFCTMCSLLYAISCANTFIFFFLDGCHTIQPCPEQVPEQAFPAKRPVKELWGASLRWHLLCTTTAQLTDAGSSPWLPSECSRQQWPSSQKALLRTPSVAQQLYLLCSSQRQTSRAWSTSILASWSTALTASSMTRVEFSPSLKLSMTT